MKLSPGRAINCKLKKQADKDYYELESLEIDKIDYTNKAQRRFADKSEFDGFLKRNNLVRSASVEIQTAKKGHETLLVCF
ncbi:MAG: hypothetical protein LWX07_04190 [Bacteroidetes bacterium]|nr:hypothetical protein [Bacteroidota bacterium]